MSYRQKDGHLDQWNRRKSRNRLTHRWELTFDKGTKTIQEKMTIFLRNGARSLYKKFYLDPYFVPITKLNSKWTNDLQIKCKSTEFLEVKGIKSMSNYTWWVMVKLRKMWSSSPIMRFLISLSLLWIPAHRVPSPHAEVALSGPPPSRCRSPWVCGEQIPFYCPSSPPHLSSYTWLQGSHSTRHKKITTDLKMWLFSVGSCFCPIFLLLGPLCVSLWLISVRTMSWFSITRNFDEHTESFTPSSKLMMKAFNKAIPDSHHRTFLQPDTSQFNNNLSLWSCN